eukprot:912944-Prorocentrum_minimum.AAC.2
MRVRKASCRCEDPAPWWRRRGSSMLLCSYPPRLLARRQSGGARVVGRLRAESGENNLAPEDNFEHFSRPSLVGLG